MFYHHHDGIDRGLLTQQSGQGIPIDILSVTSGRLASLFQERFGKGKFHADALYRQVFQKGVFEPEMLPQFDRSAAFAARLKESIRVPLPQIVHEQSDEEVVKLVSELGDGHRIESVVVPMAHGKTLCISSQVGCRMGCAFCRTGRMGLIRNLTTSEIVGQVVNGRMRYGDRLRNIVFMGMGEPLDNFDNVSEAAAVLADPRGLDIPHRRMTLSTAGLGAGIEAMTASKRPMPYLAVSLNAANDALRTRLMPVNQATPLGRLKDLLIRYPLGKKEFILIGYVLLGGVNDTADHARELAEYLRPLKVRVNVIPFNPVVDVPYEAPTPEGVDRFIGYLVSEGVFVRKRTPKGRDLMAACGQLGENVI